MCFSCHILAIIIQIRNLLRRQSEISFSLTEEKTSDPAIVSNSQEKGGKFQLFKKYYNLKHKYSTFMSILTKLQFDWKSYTKFLVNKIQKN